MKTFMRTFTEFALEDDARRQLMFQRPIPGFEPSRASYARAEQFLDRAIRLLEAADLVNAGDIDCFVAMVAGLIDAQASNDPGGTRWIRHLDRLIDMHLDNARPRRTR